METILIRVLQLLLSLTILVVIHELGHFTFARIFKVRVEKFYMFFNPWLTLFKIPSRQNYEGGRALIQTRPSKSDTEWGIGWLPLGGYCKIAGMIDESMDTEQMKQPAQPWEFRTKPAWQRLLIIIGGVLFNFLLALFIYAMVLFTWGESYLLPKDFKQGMEYGTVAQEMGFRNGDVLLAADGEELDRWPKAVRQLAEARQVEVLRAGTLDTIYMGDGLMQRLLAENEGFATPIFPYVIDSILPQSPLDKAGFQRNDRIIALNGEPFASFSEYSHRISLLQQEGKSRTVTLTYQRGTRTDTATITLDPQYKGGAYPYGLTHYFPPRTQTYSFFASLPAGIHLGINTMQGYVNDLKYVFTKEGAGSLGGFGTIGSIFPPIWDWYSFWTMTAFLSIILAVMNILPIPALDGGHALFILYEMIFRRKPSEKFMERAQMAGMLFLLILMFWANFNDILRFVFGVNL